MRFPSSTLSLLSFVLALAAWSRNRTCPSPEPCEAAPAASVQATDPSVLRTVLESIPEPPRCISLKDSVLAIWDASGVRRRVFVPSDELLLIARLCAGDGWDLDLESYYAAFARGPGHIVEFGANLGIFSTLFVQLQRGKSDRTLVAVEASPSLVPWLQSTLVVNDAPRDTLLHRVIAKDRGDGTLLAAAAKFCAIPGGSLHGHILESEEEEARCSGGGGKVVSVLASTAATVITRPIDSYALIKIDIDGAEWLCAQSLLALMRRKKTLFRHISIEMGSNRGYNYTPAVREIVAFYEAWGGGVQILASNRCHKAALEEIVREVPLRTFCLCKERDCPLPAD
ncbi:hypothetical protein DFJ74DRAFT_215280 [Hyaloraphidium curvatum]|nr:hypothetical protein DFJ74DRAFT_215280 [Hyaloraphidium curvatum]